MNFNKPPGKEFPKYPLVPIIGQERTMSELELINPEIIKERMNNPKDPIYSKIIEVVKLVCRSNNYDYSTIEDLTQEVSVKIWKNIDSFYGNAEELNSWIYVIAQNTFLNYTRSRKNKRMDKTIPLESLEEEGRAGAMESVVALTEQDIINNIDSQTFLKFLKRKITPDNFRLLEMRYKDDQTQAQIAAKLGVTQPTVRSHILKLIKEIRELIDNAGSDRNKNEDTKTT